MKGGGCVEHTMSKNYTAFLPEPNFPTESLGISAGSL